MEKDGLIENIRKHLNDKREASTLKQADRADRSLLKIFQYVASTKDVALTLDAFGTILKDTEKHHINDAEIKSSTANALREFGGAQETLPTVFSPETYDCVARAHITPQTTIKVRPKDQVRRFISSHMARLRNECKIVSSDTRKGLLNTQISCLRTAEKEYEKLQDKAMGREPEPKKGKSRGLER
jgi:hypothetical protein